MTHLQQRNEYVAYIVVIRQDVFPNAARTLQLLYCTSSTAKERQPEKNYLGYTCI